MNEKIRPGEEIGRPFLFDDAISFFPEEEQSFAEYYVGVHQRYRESVKTDLDVYDAFLEYSEQNRSAIENCKLFHLFAGSSLPRERWLAMPMDTQGGDVKEFIENTLVPLFDKKGV